MMNYADVKGKDGFVGTTGALAWKDRGKVRKNSISVFGDLAEIRDRYTRICNKT